MTISQKDLFSKNQTPIAPLQTPMAKEDPAQNHPVGDRTMLIFKLN